MAKLHIQIDKVGKTDPWWFYYAECKMDRVYSRFPKEDKGVYLNDIVKKMLAFLPSQLQDVGLSYHRTEISQGHTEPPSFGENYQKIRVSFRSHKRMNKSEARKLVVKALNNAAEHMKLDYRLFRKGSSYSTYEKIKESELSLFEFE